MSSRALIWVAYLAALLLRLWCAQSGMGLSLQDRIELASPLTSFKRLQEGLFLERVTNTTAYAGWALHQPPLTLLLFLTFVAVDLVSAFLLSAIVSMVLKKDLADKHSVEPQRITASEVDLVPHYAAALYLLHPYSWLTSAAFSLSALDNLFLLLALLFALKGSAVLSTLFLSIATYTGLFPIMLVVPLSFILRDNKALTSSLFALFLSSLFYSSYLLSGGSWRWLKETWGFILLVPDLTPNIGLFWYYFLETFTHYRNFFLCALHLHTFSYVLPLALRVRQRPVLMFWVLLGVITLFKPYPTVADVCLLLALLPVFYRYLFCTGNANFVYAITLVHALSTGWLVSDVLGTALVWDYTSKHRKPMETPRQQPPAGESHPKSE